MNSNDHFALHDVITRMQREMEATPAEALDIAKAGTAAITEVINRLDQGQLRVAEPPKDAHGQWTVNAWIKQAILMYFKVADMTEQTVGPFTYFDKIPLKRNFRDLKVRVVPPATARFGTFMEPGVVLMPSYVNIGAWVGARTMVDTWATVGSCAQIGADVHLSGGVGIGGVLEPLQANPTIIEDHCFIGARSEVVEGVIVEAYSVLSMGVFLSQSTRILDRSTGQILYGRVPSGSVVVPGTLPSADGRCALYAAIIVKRVDAQTRAKTAINELLRGD